jgi:hypothetical protein
MQVPLALRTIFKIGFFSLLKFVTFDVKIREMFAETSQHVLPHKETPSMKSLLQISKGQVSGSGHTPHSQSGTSSPSLSSASSFTSMAPSMCSTWLHESKVGLSSMLLLWKAPC